MIKIILKVIFSIILVNCCFAIEDYESTKYKGMNQYQRIGEIEKYLEDFTKLIPKDITKKVSALEEELNKIKSMKSPEIEKMAQRITKLEEDLKKTNSELEKKIDDESAKINKRIDALEKDNIIVIDSLRTSLETKILALEKLFSNLGKVNLKN